MNPKTLGVLQLIGAIITGYLGFTDNLKWGELILALVILITAVHHLGEKKR